MDQPFDRDSLYVLRATMEAHAVQAGLPEGRTSDLVLAVHELATNVILHGSGAGRVRMLAVDGLLRCEVIDSRATAATRETPPWPYEYGHGLWIVRSLGDLHSVTRGPGGTVATIGFAVPEAGRPSFRLLQHERDGTVTLRLIGDLDQTTSGDLVAAVQALLKVRAAGRLVLDLGGMTYWDSTGIAALLSVQERVSAVPGAALTLSGLSGDFRRRLDALSFQPLSYDEPAG
ncbi:STAS domain-containing protein [Actinomadura sp. ATCC 31491]|uniref:STAS domain-containing protein n=1 Tax=Actinomadura luzonensis TaxID=2805427 RepID=A0ABT0FN97_9ACTN|nr:ATP-binding protein [Actinomadura luzonensis]MCK2213772.1 STAS domain-containing protein [Actinomadura luzonensis]